MISRVCVPSGIGDVSWMYSKLCNAPQDMVWEVADGWPHRTAPFLKMLPKVVDAEYGPFNYNEIIQFEESLGVSHNGLWSDIGNRTYGKLYLEANRHLEMGRPLVDWLPDLPCSFHYNIRIPIEEQVKADRLLAAYPRPIWGVSAASYRGSEAWKTWTHVEWCEFLHEWEMKVGGTILLLGGFWDDLTSALASEGWPDIVGKTSTPMMVHLMKQLDGYIGFSSGMGILRTVFRKPVFMLWPDHQEALSTSWAPPEMLESREYVRSLWRAPDQVFKVAQMWHKENFS